MTKNEVATIYSWAVFSSRAAKKRHQLLRMCNDGDFSVTLAHTQISFSAAP
jgi:hypothetical protein